MPIFLNAKNLAFPATQEADEDGIIALGGDLSPERLLLAYSLGIFPWPHENYPLLWFCPDPRFVLEPDNIRINKSLKKALLKTNLKIKADTNFLSVIQECSSLRVAQEGTWITQDIINAYVKLFELGYAHSIEAYENNILVGGLYGLSLGKVFFGESMFSKQTNASKICLVTLAAQLLAWDFSLIDCQAHTDLFSSLGAMHIKREDFLKRLELSNKSPTRQGPWDLLLSPQEALMSFQKSPIESLVKPG